ncbi:MAG: nucleotide sugar dehydrogenase, partial [Deltaproteobacteria bacterium]|nr:nucleotide sugar dehydrogenase [Deltaproteobacteria bacterium]
MQLLDRIKERKATVGVLGLGYVGLPLAALFSGKGFKVIGLDTDPDKVASLAQGRTYIRHIPDEVIAKAVSGGFEPTTDFSRSAECDAILICVPTPLTAHREPDMSYVVGSCRELLPHLRRDQMIILESTTYPGTTDEVMRPILEEGGLTANRDFWLAYSPEREDPNNADFDTGTIPKVVGADDPKALELAKTLYEQVIVGVI